MKVEDMRRLGRLTSSDIDWFDDRLGQPNEHGCRVWKHAVDRTGNGVLHIRGVWIRARKLVWYLDGRKLPAPPNLLINKCPRNDPRCCAAAHARIGTPSACANHREERKRAAAAHQQKVNA